jgi:hypothetical protein
VRLQMSSGSSKWKNQWQIWRPILEPSLLLSLTGFRFLAKLTPLCNVLHNAQFIPSLPDVNMLEHAWPNDWIVGNHVGIERRG